MLKQQATNLSSIKLILALQRKSVMLEATLYSHIVASNINKICTIINSVYNLLLQPHTARTRVFGSYEEPEGSRTRCHPSAGNSELPACLDCKQNCAFYHLTTQAHTTLTLLGVVGTANITKW